VRLSRVSGPILTGRKRSERAASSAVGQRASGIWWRVGFSGCHMLA
jgi:hypothetical protein